MLSRRRMMMSALEIGGAKYPLVNGTHIFDNGTSVEVTNDNHVKIMFSVFSANIAVNLSNIKENSQRADDGTANTRNKPEKFAFQPNSIVTLKIKNVVSTGHIYEQKDFAFRQANGTSTIKPVLKLGNNLNGEVTENNLSLASVGCLFVYFLATDAGSQIEFDVELSVDGERWI